MSDEFTPTDEQVRYGYAVDPEADYRDPLTNHTRFGERAFDRWLAAHDARVKAEALESAADYAMTGGQENILSEWLRARAAEYLTAKKGTTDERH